MALAITWTDAADATGGTVAVTGSDVGQTVTINAMAVDATGLRTPTFSQVGSRTGDGDVTITPAANTVPGYLWIYASGTVSGSPAISNLVYALASDNSEALASRCVDALASRLAGLTMDPADDTPSGTAPNANIYKRILPSDYIVQYPCIILSHEGQSEGQPGTLTQKDDVEYPVNVYLADRNDGNNFARRKSYLLWRQQMFRALRNQRLAGITEVLTVKVQPMQVFDPKLPAYGLVVCGLVCRVWVRETRGV